jgi:hypothetical protein
MSGRPRSTIRCTIWRCWSIRAAPWIKAAPLGGWQLPDCFAHLRHLLEARLSKHAGREYIQVLRLLETFAVEEVTAAAEDALQLGTISFDAVRHLVLCRAFF